VDENNRFTVYGIQDLGSQLAPVAMLVMMEAIQSRIVENGRKGRATWLYIDECHVLLSSDYSATYLQQLWKKVRKQGGLCTGISQNVTDLLQNYIASTLISNSEFVALLKQSNIDSAKLAEVIGVSDSQLEFVNNSPSGTGLIKCGSVVIPFDNTIGKDTELYKLYNTNMHEKAEELKNQAETVQARKEDAGAEETGADTSLIRGCIASSMNQKKSAPAAGFTPIVEQPAAKYNSWLIY
jgi:type IV secretory pathway VirB4 component